MNCTNQLKKISILVQFSDGSVSSVIFPINRKSILFESDYKSICLKVSDNLIETDDIKLLNDYKLLFKKSKTQKSQ